MPPWKVWTNDYDLLFEGTDDDAREYVRQRFAVTPGLTLESPDGASYSYQDGTWVFQGAAGMWGPNGAYELEH
jgi:hypothetical protein